MRFPLSFWIQKTDNMRSKMPAPGPSPENGEIITSKRDFICGFGLIGSRKKVWKRSEKPETVRGEIPSIVLETVWNVIKEIMERIHYHTTTTNQTAAEDVAVRLDQIWSLTNNSFSPSHKQLVLPHTLLYFSHTSPLPPTKPLQRKPCSATLHTFTTDSNHPNHQEPQHRVSTPLNSSSLFTDMFLSRDPSR